MIITTTNSIEGKKIKKYIGITFGEVISGVNFAKDFMAGLRDFMGGRSEAYENELSKARVQAIEELKERATEAGADAVIGVDVDYEVLGSNGSMLMVTVSGTAVTLE